jgi:hypothetical protein
MKRANSRASDSPMMRSASRSPVRSRSPSPSASPLPSPSRHSSNLQTTTLDGRTLEELSPSLGYPDFYDVETNLKYHAQLGYVPEWTFSGEFAVDGYRDVSLKRLNVVPQRSFAEKANLVDFMAILEDQETLLRESWMTWSTKKTREEKQALFKNARRACECDAPKIGYPNLLFSDSNRFLIMLQTKSLRELSTQIPPLQLKNCLDLISTNNIPFVRAAWLIRMVCINQSKKRADWNQIWMDNLITFLNETKLTITTAMYMARFMSWCMNEVLIDIDQIRQWFASKMDDLSGKRTYGNVNFLEIYMDSVHDEVNPFINVVNNIRVH